jgi:antitoxin component of RelBE/YafQ-DinJ toxin-antitoxin module
VIIVAKTATISARIEPHLKQEVEKFLKEMGLTATEAINLSDLFEEGYFAPE